MVVIQNRSDIGESITICHVAEQLFLQEILYLHCQKISLPLERKDLLI